MNRQLHILTHPPDALVREILDTLARKETGTEIEVFDLTGNDPDYGKLVERVFAADAIATW